MYGASYQRSRKERLAFASHMCEACQSKESLECHHRGSLAYQKDEQELMTMNDVVILCVRHHDAITNSDRQKRNLERATVLPESAGSNNCADLQRKRNDD